MGTFWKELVRLGESAVVSLKVFDDEGEMEISLRDTVKVGKDAKITIFLKERKITKNLLSSADIINFETSHREFFIELMIGDEKFYGGNSKWLKDQNKETDNLISDTFEERVATYNYYEQEMGKDGADTESILMSKSKKRKGFSEDDTVTDNVIQTLQAVDVIENIEIETKLENIEDVENSYTQDQDQDFNEEPKNIDEDESDVIFEEKSSYTSRRKKKSFFEMVKTDIDRLFRKFPKEEFLEEYLENSRWVKVEFTKDVFYAVGLIYNDEMVQYIGYGAIGRQGACPKEFEDTQFLPLDIDKPEGEGYFLLFQRADNGEKV